MKSDERLLVRGLVVILIVLLVAVIGMDWYIQSEGFRQAAMDEATR